MNTLLSRLVCITFFSKIKPFYYFNFFSIPENNFVELFNAHAHALISFV